MTDTECNLEFKRFSRAILIVYISNSHKDFKMKTLSSEETPLYRFSAEHFTSLPPPTEVNTSVIASSGVPCNVRSKTNLFFELVLAVSAFVN